MKTAAALLLAAGGAWAADQPNLRYSMPSPIEGGKAVEITIPRFDSRNLVCSAFISGTKAKSGEFPCGPSEAVLRLAAPIGLAVSKVYVGVSACTAKMGRPDVVCWSYGGDEAYTTSDSPQAGAVTGKGVEAARTARTARAPAEGGPAVGDGAPTLLRSRETPAAPAQSAPLAKGWAAEAPAAPAAAPLPTGKRVRGHDGRMYDREDPPAGSVADRDEAYRKALAEDPATKKAVAEWKTLGPEERRAALQRMADIQADAYGLPRSRVVLSPTTKPGEIAHYDPKDRTLTMNTASPYAESPLMQVNAVTHEARHRYQHSLIDRLPALPEGEERDLGRAFKASWDVYCSPNGVRRCDYPTYRAQFVERDAFDQGETAALYLRARRG